MLRRMTATITWMFGKKVYPQNVEKKNVSRSEVGGR